MDDTERRLVSLEDAQQRMVHAVFGNGEAGLDERIRIMEAWQIVANRKLDSLEMHAARQEKQSDRLLGGWSVVKWVLVIGIPGLTISLIRVFQYLEAILATSGVGG